MKMIIIIVCMFLMVTDIRAELPSFPGALGFGAKATGGRQGSVYHVTNLNDNGAGSFRDAVSSSNRIIIFDTAGYINLKTAVLVKSNNTIAGQTAPGEGIGFRGGEISFANGSNIICRYIRVRPGSETESDKDDALSLYRAKNAILDHCSFEFGPWNNIDGVSDDWKNVPVTDITFQNCLIANPTGQQFGAHCESVNSQWAWFYCIFANSHNRNPLSKVNDLFVNNVIYNYSAGYTTHTSTKFKHDIINNHFIFGPASTGTDNTWFQVDKNQSIYCSGNIKDKNMDGELNGDTTLPYWYQGTGIVLSSPWSLLASDVPVYSSRTAYRMTTSFAGTLPRDQMDSLIINQVKTLGKGTTGLTAGTVGPASSLYTSQAQTGLSNNGYGIIRGGIKEIDSDNDGMPDYWEKTAGTDVNSNDAMTIASDGYTNIEHYINWLGDFHARTSSDKEIRIDIQQYASGFSNVKTVFSVKDAKNGAAVIDEDGHTVKFIPNAGFYGLASFTFTIIGEDNTEFSATMTVAVAPSDIPLHAKDNSGRIVNSEDQISFKQNIITIKGRSEGYVRISDVSGRSVMQRRFRCGSESAKFKIPGETSGVYMVKISTGKKQASRMVLVAN